MDKYLVFRLQKWVKTNVSEVEHGVDGIIQAVWREPVYEDRLVPCFELVKEFEINIAKGAVKMIAAQWARQYSVDNKIKTLVVKGTVFEG